MTSIQQRRAVGPSPASMICCPGCIETAQATEDRRKLLDENVAALDEWASSGWSSPNSGAGCSAIRRSSRGGPATGQRVRFHQLGRGHPRHPQLAPGPVRPGRPGRGVGRDTSVRVSSSYAPMGAGVVTESGDGYIVNGTWCWSSGCDHATWAFLGGPSSRTASRSTSAASCSRSPTTASTTTGGWSALKGTGSNNIVVKDVFVPRHRFLSYKAMNDHRRRLKQHRAGVPDALGLVHPTTISTPIVEWPTEPTRPTSSTRVSGCARRTPGRRPGRPVRQDPHRRSGQRHRRRLASADGQRRWRIRVSR